MPVEWANADDLAAAMDRWAAQLDQMLADRAFDVPPAWVRWMEWVERVWAWLLRACRYV